MMWAWISVKLTSIFLKWKLEELRKEELSHIEETNKTQALSLRRKAAGGHARFKAE